MLFFTPLNIQINILITKNQPCYRLVFGLFSQRIANPRDRVANLNLLGFETLRGLIVYSVLFSIVFRFIKFKIF